MSSYLASPPFYDFIKTAFKRSIGYIDADPESSHLKRLYNRKDLPPLKRRPADLDELAETLEGSLQAAHRPIGEEGTITRISVASPRQELVRFDHDSKDWVNTRDEAAITEVFRGNVTRYNSISRNGRAFIDQLDRVVPIRPDSDFPSSDLAYLTWSLHGSNVREFNKLDMNARKVTSASGKTKRLLLVDCRRAPRDL